MITMLLVRMSTPFSYDYSTHIGSTSGETDKYTFTIVNRDGLVNEVSVTLTVQ